MKFPAVDSNPDFPVQEKAVLQFWEEKNIYQKSLDQRLGAEKYVFYEGPPTANGKPHPGHCLTRAMKDLYPRYKTMKGFYCERKAGWDTHGLPVEVEVCKDLGIHSKEEIESYGIEPFIQKCQQSVWQYMRQWEQLTERLGFWVKLDDAYVTYSEPYVESVWWSLKNLFDRGLLYQGNKIVWWWAQGGTALSAGEVGQGYKNVVDPSVYVTLPLLDRDNCDLLVWTTTPWTLPCNQFAVVHPDIDYAEVQDPIENKRWILAAELVESIAEKVNRDLKVVTTFKGAELVGLRYRPPFHHYYEELGDQTGATKEGSTEHIAWRVVGADFVTTENGSGVVHAAPAFGEVDYALLLDEQARFQDGEGPQLICSVHPNGTFTSDFPEYEGLWVKDVDKLVIRRLKDEGKLFHRENYQHDYPFCWRSDDDPLIQYPRKSWFVRTTQFKDRLLDNNHRINWLPGHIRDGRFGKFLESNVDWALSRERFWGTPLPIWVCSVTGKMEAIESYSELLRKPEVDGLEYWRKAKSDNPELPDDLRIHKPYIDYVTYQSPFAEEGRMERVSEVIDCWYDSGAMPFAQWGYPHQNKDCFEQQFPADFISEAIDQTRGWFYSLLAVSTLVFSDDSEHGTLTFPHPYKNCVVLGLMLGEDGQKMSKSKRNYREPNEIFEKYGADALRWYFFSNQPPWTAIRYREQAIKESMPEFLLRLWNVLGFFVLYANIDHFAPESSVSDNQLKPNELSGTGRRDTSERGELDRWILSELNRTVDSVTVMLDAYDNYGATGRINQFVDALSNWYVRRSRQRFWAEDKSSQEKLDAHWTLYECLVTTAKMIAPFVPFLAETMWQTLSKPVGNAVNSVHLCDYPVVNNDEIDSELVDRMSLIRELASLGRSARAEARIKVRQPLESVTVIMNNHQLQSWTERDENILRSELNVRRVVFASDKEEFVNLRVVPNFQKLGPRLGKLMPKVKSALLNVDGLKVSKELVQNGKFDLPLEDQDIELSKDDISIMYEAKKGFAATHSPMGVCVLDTKLTDELKREGVARDLVRNIQSRRKELDLDFVQSIVLGLKTEDENINRAISDNENLIMQETLATRIVYAELESVEPTICHFQESVVKVFIQAEA